MSVFEKLDKLGCDTDGIKDRFMQDEEFYEECFDDFKQSEEVENFKEIISTNDVDEIFSVAHSLKGTISNLGLTPMYDYIYNIVEKLRKGSTEGIEDQYMSLLKKWDEIVSAL